MFILNVSAGALGSFISCCMVFGSVRFEYLSFTNWAYQICKHRHHKSSSFSTYTRLVDRSIDRTARAERLHILIITLAGVNMFMVRTYYYTYL